MYRTLSRTLKNLRFHPTSKPRSQSWMAAEDMRLLSQSNERFISHSNSSDRISALAKVPSALFLQGNAKKTRCHPHMQWAVLQKRNLKYSELNYFMMVNKPDFCSGFCMNICFHFSQVKTQKQECWIMWKVYVQIPLKTGTKAGSASACKTCTNLRDQLDGIQCLIKHIHYYQKHYCQRPALDKLLGHLFIPGKESRILKGCYFLPASIPLSLKHHSNGRYPFWVENKIFQDITDRESIGNTLLIVAAFLTLNFYNISPHRTIQSREKVEDVYDYKLQASPQAILIIFCSQVPVDSKLLFVPVKLQPTCDLPFLLYKFWACLASPQSCVNQFLTKVHVQAYPHPYINIHPTSYASLAKP